MSSEAFIIKTEEELTHYSSLRGTKSIVSNSLWNELFNGASAIGYPRVVTDEKKGYDNRITPPIPQKNRAAAMNKKIKIQACFSPAGDPMFKIYLVAA